MRFREAQENALVSQDNCGSNVLTGQKIKKCFEIASTTSRLKKSRYGIPSDETCDFIAESVERNFSELGRPFSDPILGKAQDHARDFLKYLPAAKETIARWYLDHQEGGTPARENPHLDGIVKIQAAEDAVKALLDKYERKKQRPYDWRDLAGWISAWGVHGWRECGNFPKGADPDGPMCLFVCEVLRGLGISKELSNISDVLKGKRAQRETKPQRRGKKQEKK
jgi:hypothetical protein